jgi:hypothetical protein
MNHSKSRGPGGALLSLAFIVPAGIVLAGANNSLAVRNRGELVEPAARPTPCVSGKLQYLTKSDGQFWLGKLTAKPDEFLTCNCEPKKVTSDDKLTDADENCEKKTDPTHIPPE